MRQNMYDVLPFCTSDAGVGPAYALERDYSLITYSRIFQLLLTLKSKVIVSKSILF